MIGPQRSARRSSRREPVSARTLVAAALFVALGAVASAKAEEQSKCSAAPHLLWGDGEHDDTAALNAWFRGETVVWAQTHEPIGAEIADRTFLLSSVVYISSGTGRTLERFRLVWPERQETVSGGTIRSGDDPDQPPVAEGVTTIGADPDEGVPYEGPAPEPLDHGVPRHCLTS
ncbi:MAG: hypothetical protein JOZ11_07740 [Alphaproteobacteria bacterium]|nr:hypothetical protein [Alphaproteobacteria bacterium]